MRLFEKTYSICAKNNEKIRIESNYYIKNIYLTSYYIAGLVIPPEKTFILLDFSSIEDPNPISFTNQLEHPNAVYVLVVNNHYIRYNINSRCCYIEGIPSNGRNTVEFTLKIKCPDELIDLYYDKIYLTLELSLQKN